MRQRFIHKKFKEESLARIATANQIITQYDDLGLRLTLRQLYYQFVAHHGLPNNERSYQNLGKLISEARLAGLVDWEAIEDRGRQPDVPGQWSSIDVLVDAAVRQFRLPRWSDQENYVELWVEKQALAGVLEPIADERHITLMVNKGYSSQSAMYVSARRFIRAGDKNCVLLYLGDHDPSGEDMVRDIDERLRLFGATVDVRKIALTMAQVEEYDPPPNPAKMSDSRATAYVEKHGDSSWEVDALDPDTLANLIRDELDNLVDTEVMDRVVAREEEQKDMLGKALKKIRSKLVED
jgi:hypothetical protein